MEYRMSSVQVLEIWLLGIVYFENCGAVLWTLMAIGVACISTIQRKKSCNDSRTGRPSN